MKILLIGNGAREHCIAEALTKSGRAELGTFAKAKNPGIAALSQTAYRLGSLSDFAAIGEFAKKLKPDFAFIGPDDPIAEGLADFLLTLNIPSVAPFKTVARLESSKSFTRDLVDKYGIPGNPRYETFYDPEGVRTFMESLQGNFVVKADGLMGGKGVKVSGEHLKDVNEGEVYAKECLEKFGSVVIEEKLIGQEFSLMSFVDGLHVVDMMPVQDHKRAFEGDAGPNTGGMGSYSDANHSLPFLTKKDLDAAHEITVRVAMAVAQETGIPFKGILYGGFMAVADGIRLIEFNARFGDPEVMNALPLLKNDYLEVCDAILHGTLDRTKISFEPKATVCKYLVPEGYPDQPRAGERIEIEKDNEVAASNNAGDVRMYYSSVDERADGLFLSSSRAVAFVGIADTLEKAEQIAENACALVKGPVFHRTDVGTKALIEKRVAMMKQLRNL